MIAKETGIKKPPWKRYQARKEGRSSKNGNRVIRLPHLSGVDGNRDGLENLTESLHRSPGLVQPVPAQNTSEKIEGDITYSI